MIIGWQAFIRRMSWYWVVGSKLLMETLLSHAKEGHRSCYSLSLSLSLSIPYVTELARGLTLKDFGHTDGMTILPSTHQEIEHTNRVFLVPRRIFYCIIVDTRTESGPVRSRVTSQHGSWKEYSVVPREYSVVLRCGCCCYYCDQSPRRWNYYCPFV